jgi:uncharacterized protein DUF1569
MNSHLDRLHKELETVLHESTSMNLARGPAGKWNADQILEHLLLSYTATSKGLGRCLEKGTPPVIRSTVRHRLATMLLLDIGYFPRGRKSPERAEPRGMPPDEVRQGILSALDVMASRLDECERKFGGRTRILDHPILGPLTAEQWRKFHWVHGRHHAKQIRERVSKA